MKAYFSFCRALERAGVQYVMVGAFGINVYCRARGPVISTDDGDLLLPPDPEQLATAMRILRKQGYALEAGGEPQVDEDPDNLRGIIRARFPLPSLRIPYSLFPIPA